MYFTIRSNILFLLLITFGSAIWLVPCHDLLSHQKEKYHKAFQLQFLLNCWKTVFRLHFWGWGKKSFIDQHTIFWMSFVHAVVLKIYCCFVHATGQKHKSCQQHLKIVFKHTHCSKSMRNKLTQRSFACTCLWHFFLLRSAMGISICFLLLRCCSCSETFEASVSYLRSWVTN